MIFLIIFAVMLMLIAFMAGFISSAWAFATDQERKEDKLQQKEESIALIKDENLRLKTALRMAEMEEVLKQRGIYFEED